MTVPAPSRNGRPHPDRTEITVRGGEKIVYATSGPMKNVMEEALKVAPTDYSVLLLGKTGVGKDKIARYIHEKSRRFRGEDNSMLPYVVFDCASVNENLIESKLFGHVKGAFTGADKEMTGLFETANQGTIFIDELDKMPKQCQDKLLGVLERKEFEKVGSHTKIPVNVRVIAAANRLTAKNDKGHKEWVIKPDLYYRLGRWPITIPSLKDRAQDIPILAEHFICEAARELGYATPPHLSDEALNALRRHPWRGNVRELSNVVAAATLRAGDGGMIKELDLKLNLKATPQAVGFGADSATTEIGAIILADRSMKSAAQETNVRYNTLRPWVKDPTFTPHDVSMRILFDVHQRDPSSALRLFDVLMKRMEAQHASRA